MKRERIAIRIFCPLCGSETSCLHAIQSAGKTHGSCSCGDDLSFPVLGTRQFDAPAVN